MTIKQREALQSLQDANGHGVVLGVRMGQSLVNLGVAIKLNTGHHGNGKAEYRAV